MAKQDEILQKVNDYCTEKQYTLNDDFRSKFSEKFASVNAEADIHDENVLNSIKFNIDTAFSAASKELKIKDETWKTEKSEYLKQIESLKKSQSQANSKPVEQKVKIELPEDIKTQLDELNKFKVEKQQQEKRANVLEIAKKDVRPDLHKDLEEVLNIMQIDYNKDALDLAGMLNSNFSKLYIGKIGDIRPGNSISEGIKDTDILKGMKKIKIQ